MMTRYIFTLLFVLFSSHALAEEPANALVLSEASIHRGDVDSIRRGAKLFATTCMTCHSLVYLRYDKLAKEEGITLDKMPLNIKVWPNGIVPPDLSLEADIRGVDWIYTYLHSFYQDTSRPAGANNLLVPNTGMPSILSPYQGQQTLNLHPEAMRDLFGRVRWYDLVILTKIGSMDPEKFDATVNDLVNFLAYAAAPYHQEQQKIGYWVLGFLVVLFVMLYFLKKEYWKDIKQNKKIIKAKRR